MSIRTIVVSREEAGRPVASILKHHFHISWSEARRLVDQRRVRQGPRLCREAQGRVRAGQKIRVRLESLSAKHALMPKHDQKEKTKAHKHREGMAPEKGQVRRTSGPQPVLRHVDAHIVVVEKPAGMTTMRHAHEAAEVSQRRQRYLPTTLADMLPMLLAEAGKGSGRVIAVHRLDRDTSGLVVFARTPTAARKLGTQFREHTTERTYLAIVRGSAKAERIESLIIPDRGDGRRGSDRAGETEGHRAVTHVRVVEPLGDFTLVECRLETGRTHQARIHLGESGAPICGEHIYDRPLHGRPMPDRTEAKRLMLHAASLAIAHPATGKQMRWTAEMPVDMKRLLDKLRSRPRE